MKTQTIKFHFDPKTRIAYGEFVGYYKHEEFLHRSEYYITQLEENKASKYLLDLVKLRVMTPEIQDYINGEWYPKAYAAGLRHFAMLQPASAISQMALNKVSHYKDMTIHHFATQQEAEDWLNNVQ